MDNVFRPTLSQDPGKFVVFYIYEAIFDSQERQLDITSVINIPVKYCKNVEIVLYNLIDWFVSKVRIY